MSKGSRTKPAEWKGNIETIFKKASSRAYVENHGRKKKPDRERFKKEVVSYTPQFVSEHEDFIVRHFGDFKRKEFLDYFRLTRSRLERGENLEDLEEIIQQWYGKLEKEWFDKLGKVKP